MTDLPDLAQLTDRDLGNFIRDLRFQIVAAQAQLEAPTADRRRTVKLFRGTVLLAGGLIGATFEPLTAFLAVVGLWDWVDAIEDDVSTMNRQLHLRRALIELDLLIRMAEAELDRRISARGRK